MRVYLTLCSREDRSHEYSLDVLRSIFGNFGGLGNLKIPGNMKGSEGIPHLRGDLENSRDAMSQRSTSERQGCICDYGSSLEHKVRYTLTSLHVPKIWVALARERRRTPPLCELRSKLSPSRGRRFSASKKGAGRNKANLMGRRNSLGNVIEI